MEVTPTVAEVKAVAERNPRPTKKKVVNDILLAAAAQWQLEANSLAKGVPPYTVNSVPESNKKKSWDPAVKEMYETIQADIAAKVEELSVTGNKIVSLEEIRVGINQIITGSYSVYETSREIKVRIAKEKEDSERAMITRKNVVKRDSNVI